VTVLERNARTAESRVLAACRKEGNRLAAIRAVRRHLQDCGEPNGHNDAIAWAQRRGINLGPKNEEEKR